MSQRRQKHFWQKVPFPQGKNACVGMSGPHTSLTTAIVLIFPKVCGFCQLFLLFSLSTANLGFTLLNLLSPTFICTCQWGKQQQTEGKCLRCLHQSWAQAYLYSQLDTLTCTWIWEVPWYTQWEPSWESCGGTLSPTHTALLFLWGWIWSSIKMKGSKPFLKPCNTRRGISLLSMDATNTHQHKQYF